MSFFVIEGYFKNDESLMKQIFIASMASLIGKIAVFGVFSENPCVIGEERMHMSSFGAWILGRRHRRIILFWEEGDNTVLSIEIGATCRIVNEISCTLSFISRAIQRHQISSYGVIQRSTSTILQRVYCKRKLNAAKWTKFKFKSHNI